MTDAFTPPPAETDPTKQADKAKAIDAAALMQLLTSVIDPEAGISIVDMGLIYELRLLNPGVYVKMTMTSAACPMGDLLTEEITHCLRQQFPAPQPIDIDITFDPPWTPAMMSESARKQFGW